jgi:hypothetical protein
VCRVRRTGHDRGEREDRGLSAEFGLVGSLDLDEDREPESAGPMIETVSDLGAVDVEPTDRGRDTRGRVCPEAGAVVAPLRV